MLSVWFWIMYCCIPTHTTDSNTRTGMIWVTLNMTSAAEECRKLSVNRQGILHCLESGHLVKDILMKTSLDCYTVVNLNHFIVSVLSIKVLLPQWDLLLNINILFIKSLWMWVKNMEQGAMVHAKNVCWWKMKSYWAKEQEKSVQDF